MSEALNSSDSYRPLPIVVGAESETGRREENQDHMTGFTSRFGAVYVVADGMGGHRGGAEASRMVTEGVRTHLLDASEELSLDDAVRQAAQLTNRDLYNKNASGDPNFAGMGSTLSLVVIGEGSAGMECVTAHVGDSRVYLERDGHLSVLTKDHTYVQKLLDSKLIDEEAARTHPDASVLTRAMGQAPDVVVDVGAPILLADGDGILLCSDGLSGYVPHQFIEETVRQHPSPSDCAKALVELALASGSDDNVTVQFVRFGHSPSSPIAPHRNRKTEPESEALSFPANAPPTGPIRSWSSRWLFAIAAIVFLFVAGGLYAFRHTVFPGSATFASPYAKEMKQAGDLNNLVIHLQGLVAKDLEQVKSEMANAANDARLPEFATIEATFQKLDGAMNDLEARTQALPNRLSPAAGARDASPPSRDPAIVSRFSASYKSASDGLADQQAAYNQAHQNLRNLESKPGVPQSPPAAKAKKKKRAHQTEEDGQ